MDILCIYAGGATVGLGAALLQGGVFEGVAAIFAGAVLLYRCREAL